MNKIIYTLSICVFIVLNVNSQSLLSHKNPFGHHISEASGASFGAGGISIGVIDNRNGMLTNPANLGFIDRMNFSSSVLYNTTLLNDDGDKGTVRSVFPTQLSLSLPLSKFGILAFSFEKKTHSGFNFVQDSLFQPSNLYVKRIVEYKGGTNMWKLGYGRTLFPSLGSKKVPQSLSIGLAYTRSYHATPITILTQIDQKDSANATTSAVTANRDSTYISTAYNGVQGGILYSIKDITIGMSGHLTIPTDLSYTNTLYQGNSDQPLVSSQGSLSLSLPDFYGFGVSYKINKAFTVGADLRLTTWKEYTVRKPIGDIPDRVKELYINGEKPENTMGFNIGGQYIPVNEQLSTKYWETIEGRLGFRFTQLPTGNSSEWAIPLGLSFPLRANGMFDWGIEFGQRKSSDLSSYKEGFIGMFFGISGGKKWHKSTEFVY